MYYLELWLNDDTQETHLSVSNQQEFGHEEAYYTLEELQSRVEDCLVITNEELKIDFILDKDNNPTNFSDLENGQEELLERMNTFLGEN